MAVDAIVNAANESLLGGGGVDGAIHRAAGPDLVKESSRLGGCKVGEAKITKGYRLPAKHVIHTVGPKYWMYKVDEAARLLTSCYQSSLDVAKENDLHSIAFPCISAGVFGYPLEDSCKIATETVISWLRNNKEYEMEVTFVCFDEQSYKAYYDKLSGK